MPLCNKCLPVGDDIEDPYALGESLAAEYKSGDQTAVEWERLAFEANRIGPVDFGDTMGILVESIPRLSMPALEHAMRSVANSGLPDETKHAVVWSAIEGAITNGPWTTEFATLAVNLGLPRHDAIDAICNVIKERFEDADIDLSDLLETLPTLFKELMEFARTRSEKDMVTGLGNFFIEKIDAEIGGIENPNAHFQISYDAETRHHVIRDELTEIIK